MEFRLQPTNWVSALTESWSPATNPASYSDLEEIRQEAHDLSAKGHYEEAFQRYLWYHNHALEYGGSNPVRLSFGLSDWAELGRRYPKARQALLEIRDRDQVELLEGRGNFDVFMEFSSVNQYLQHEEATYSLFKTLEKADPDLARRCYSMVESLLVKHGEYDLCLHYVRDPQAAFDGYRRSWEMRRDSNRRMAEAMKASQLQMESSRRKMAAEHPEFRVPEPSRPFFPDQTKMTDDSFVGQVRQLVEILVGAKHKADAEKIRDQAVALLDNPRLKSAVEDAERATAAPRSPAQPSPNAAKQDNNR